MWEDPGRVAALHCCPQLSSSSFSSSQIISFTHFPINLEALEMGGL